ncbi:MAG: PD-(D/E)XK nuclease family protein [Methylotenera sp.]
MKIRLGLQLDGQRGWHVGNFLGEITVGMNGMLGILEPQLGLIAESVPQSQRVVQYLDCLKHCDHKGRFYHSSLQADELGTAATLLNWRDLWHLHGWGGEIKTMTSGRMADMADVEHAAIGKVASSDGERLTMILQAMERRKPAISKVTLTTHLSAFPKRWQQVLSRLPTELASLEAAPDGGLFLHTLQDRLRKVQSGQIFKEEDRLLYLNDGSVTVVRAETRLLASRWLADRMSHGIEDGVLVASNGAALLDDILVSAGQARHGLSESSAYRPALQLLPMALALLWAPLDFNVLISFLSHPISPVRSYARRQLAGKLASQPGIGGEKWIKALTKIDEHYGDEAAVVREQIMTWIDHPRFDQNVGVPINDVMARTQKLAGYFRVRLADQDEAKRASWNAGFSQTTAFIHALEQLQHNGASVIRQRQLQKLLAQTTSRGSANPKLVAEVGSLAVVDDPSALIEPFDQVVWWQPVMPNIPKSYPWSISERQMLAESGVDLPDITDILDNLAADWLKPILAARKQVVIVLPPKDAEVHPAWQMISAQVRDIDEQPLEHIFKDESSVTENSIVVPHTPLPQEKRWWNLPADTPISKRDHDSFSSLESFLFNPYQWLLRYPAALKASNILSVSDGFLLDGQLAHAIVENFFALPNPLSMTDDQVITWFDQTFPKIVETEGAVLLMHGRRSDYEGLRYRLRRALTTLLVQLKSAGVNTVQSELELNGHYSGGDIIGYADLVLTNNQGNHAIVDMKWGGVKKYTGKLTENTHLQLGIYAELLRQKAGAWPDVGYYVLAESKLITQHDNYFPDATVVNKKIEESTPHLWERFKETHAWRSQLLLEGKVEVVLENIEETVDSATPENGLNPENLNPNYNDYLTLAGWR